MLITTIFDCIGIFGLVLIAIAGLSATVEYGLEFFDTDRNDLGEEQ